MGIFDIMKSFSDRKKTLNMFSGAAKFVCDVCHMRLQSKETLEKHEERHQKVTFKLKGKV